MKRQTQFSPIIGLHFANKKIQDRKSSLNLVRYLHVTLDKGLKK